MSTSEIIEDSSMANTDANDKLPVLLRTNSPDDGMEGLTQDGPAPPARRGTPQEYNRAASESAQTTHSLGSEVDPESDSYRRLRRRDDKTPPMSVSVEGHNDRMILNRLVAVKTPTHRVTST